MAGASRKGIDEAGGVLLEGDETVLVNGAAFAFDGVSVARHGDAPHSSPTMIASTGSVFVGGIPVIREGDSATCGHTVSGSDNVFVGG